MTARERPSDRLAEEGTRRVTKMSGFVYSKVVIQEKVKAKAKAKPAKAKDGHVVVSESEKIDLGFSIDKIKPDGVIPWTPGFKKREILEILKRNANTVKMFKDCFSVEGPVFGGATGSQMKFIYDEWEFKADSFADQLSEGYIGGVEASMVPLSVVEEHDRQDRDREDRLTHEHLTTYRQDRQDRVEDLSWVIDLVSF